MNLTETIVQKIEVQPGDTLFVTLKGDNISYRDVLTFKAELKQAFPDNKVVLISGVDEIDIKVVYSKPEN